MRLNGKWNVNGAHLHVWANFLGCIKMDYMVLNWTNYDELVCFKFTARSGKSVLSPGLVCSRATSVALAAEASVEKSWGG